jgi:DNA-directed RNA polymerase specialized sigma24 family protein
MVQMQAAAAAAPNEQPIRVDVYQRLKAMASRQRLRGGAPRTLCTTELVHEAYLRMGSSELRFQQPAQFFAYAARAMRHILLDRAYRRVRVKVGGDAVHVDLDDPGVGRAATSPQLALQLDAALTALEAADARAARGVEQH